MRTFTVKSENPDATFEFGRRLGRQLRGGEAVLLSGPLGAGKTLLTKGMMSGLGYDEAEVTSPSFTLVNKYEADLTVYHIDLWRIEHPEGAAFSVGLEELLEDEEAVMIIEWAERLGDFNFGPQTIRIELAGDGDDPRFLTVNGMADMDEELSV